MTRHLMGKKQSIWSPRIYLLDQNRNQIKVKNVITLIPLLIIFSRIAPSVGKNKT